MSASRAKRLEERLDSICSRSPDLEAAALISVEGLLLAASLPDELDEALVASMSAAMLALGERVAGDLGRGALDEVIIRGERGYALLRAVDEKSVLAALATGDAKLGMLFLDLRDAVADLRAAL